MENKVKNDSRLIIALLFLKEASINKVLNESGQKCRIIA
jgi:hypothetical protein